MTVVDASVLAYAIGNDGPGGRYARGLLRDAGQLVAPDLVDVETTAVLRRRWFAGEMDDRRFEEAVEDLSDIPIARFPTRPLMRRAYELRANVTAYDACYVALAEGLDRPLLTADGRLTRASGPRCVIRLVTAPGA